MITLLDRGAAVSQIAEHIGGGRECLLAGAAVPAFLAALAQLPEWRCYVDNGRGRVVLFVAGRDDAEATASALSAAATVAPLALVVAVPESTPRGVLLRVLGLEPGHTGSPGMFVLSDDDGDRWPVLLVDGVDLCDPIAAARLRAQSAPARACSRKRPVWSGRGTGVRRASRRGPGR